MGFFERMTGQELPAEQAGLDLDLLQAQLTRIADALEKIERKLP